MSAKFCGERRLAKCGECKRAGATQAGDARTHHAASTAAELRHVKATATSAGSLSLLLLVLIHVPAPVGGDGQGLLCGLVLQEAGPVLGLHVLLHDVEVHLTRTHGVLAVLQRGGGGTWECRAVPGESWGKPQRWKASEQRPIPDHSQHRRGPPRQRIRCLPRTSCPRHSPWTRRCRGRRGAAPCTALTLRRCAGFAGAGCATPTAQRHCTHVNSSLFSVSLMSVSARSDTAMVRYRESLRWAHLMGAWMAADMVLGVDSRCGRKCPGAAGG